MYSVVSGGRERTPVLTWRAKKNIYEIDFSKRSIETLIESKDEDIKFVFDNRDIQKTLNYNTRSKPNVKLLEGYQPAIGYVAGSGACEILFIESGERVAFKMSKEWLSGNRPSVTISVFEDAIYAQHTENNRPKLDWKYKTSKEIDEYVEMVNKTSIHFSEDVYEVSSTGELESLNTFEWDSVPNIKVNGPRNYDPYSGQDVLKKLTCVSPIFYSGLLKAMQKCIGPGVWRDSVLRIWSEIIGGTQYLKPWSVGLTMLVSILLSGVVFWHGMFRRRGPYGLAFWMVFVVVFNVAGLLTYLALNHVPVIRCYKCRNKRHLKSEFCPSCGAGLAEPEARPTDLVKR